MMQQAENTPPPIFDSIYRLPQPLMHRDQIEDMVGKLMLQSVPRELRPAWSSNRGTANQERAHMEIDLARAELLKILDEQDDYISTAEVTRLFGRRTREWVRPILKNMATEGLVDFTEKNNGRSMIAFWRIHDAGRKAIAA